MRVFHIRRPHIWHGAPRAKFVFHLFPRRHGYDVVGPLLLAMHLAPTGPGGRHVRDKPPEPASPVVAPQRPPTTLAQKSCLVFRSSTTFVACLASRWRADSGVPGDPLRICGVKNAAADGWRGAESITHLCVSLGPGLVAPRRSTGLQRQHARARYASGEQGR